MNFCTIFVFVLIGRCVCGLRGRSSSLCGAPLSRGKIVGGVDSGGYRFPWFALLLLKKNSYIPVPVCAGSLISNIHVLTAAHCFTINASIQYDNLFTVALGVYDICNEEEKTRQIFQVANVAIHEKYRKNGKFYDIALIKLNRPANFIPICLPLSGVPDITEVALLIGFGVTKENSDFTPCHMLEVNVTKYSKSDCSASQLPLEDKEEPTVICAGTFTGDADSCYGDSGGPLQTLNPLGRYILAGIVSYGYGCGTPNIPGVYTNVGSYLEWIKEKISILGLKESDSTAKQNGLDLLDDKRGGGVSRRPKSGVTFPGQANSSQFGEEKSRAKEHELGRRRPTFNCYPSRREKGQCGGSESSKKSKVSFPE